MKTVKTRLLGLIALIALTSNFVMAQSDTKIRYTASAELFINDTPLDGQTKLKELIANLGEPSKKVDYPNGETSYFYEEIGIVFFTKDGIVKGLGINFNWDGDEKFPEKTFTGTLNLGDSEIEKETKSESIAAIKSIEFICPIPIMCASKDREAKINCAVAFKDEKLTQVAFIIN
ncbi:DUF7738 domain-containing protein [Croceimicrobium hydrocarbonivorans]|uniref:DUF7738 domain-containing protein n=1 Tax=Croceimicrobium hydrocarbonivorans TaxID=2761580 RepID=A0A7H0VHC4_9FLAO|nr:hypothetical protein [Croceimicrobium hydrocarbonivorans]QNR25122.1 hypothetical protein H4K34_04595 [Croceimicrobium hydrocarbonivorans]